MHLDPYGIIVRYPGDEQVDDRLTKQALEQAREILDWAQESIRLAAQ